MKRSKKLTGALISLFNQAAQDGCLMKQVLTWFVSVSLEHIYQDAGDHASDEWGLLLTLCKDHLLSSHITCNTP